MAQSIQYSALSGRPPDKWQSAGRLVMCVDHYGSWIFARRTSKQMRTQKTHGWRFVDIDSGKVI